MWAGRKACNKINLHVYYHYYFILFRTIIIYIVLHLTEPDLHLATFALCSRVKHSTLTVPLFTQDYTCVHDYWQNCYQKGGLPVMKQHIIQEGRGS